MFSTAFGWIVIGLAAGVCLTAILAGGGRIPFVRRLHLMCPAWMRVILGLVEDMTGHRPPSYSKRREICHDELRSYFTRKVTDMEKLYTDDQIGVLVGLLDVWTVLEMVRVSGHKLDGRFVVKCWPRHCTRVVNTHQYHRWDEYPALGACRREDYAPREHGLNGHDLG